MRASCLSAIVLSEELQPLNGSQLMTIPVLIDTCAWNWLFEREADLDEDLPRDAFKIFIPREVEIELAAVPEIGVDGGSKVGLIQYVAHWKAARVVTSSNFGFRTIGPDGTPTKAQVNAPFGHGTFQPPADRDWYATEAVRGFLVGKRTKKTGLSHNQADASLAVRSFHAVVLTGEHRTKPGPLALAANHGGRIAYLDEVERSGLPLADYVQQLAGL